MKGLRFLTIMPILLLLASVTASVSNYQKAKEEMRQDLTHALQQFVTEQSQQQLLLGVLPSLQRDRVLTLNDVENSFGKQLTIRELRDTSHVAIYMLRHDDSEPFKERAVVSSDTLLWSSTQTENNQSFVAIKAYANPSFCNVLGHSDQRLPLVGASLCLLLLSGLAWRMRMMGNNLETVAIPCQPSKANLQLTPMQEQLMEMFASAPSHTLSKEMICAALWPKKEHPENTLYTFICRLKTTLKKQSDMDIVNKRGKEYQLVENIQMTDNQHNKNV